MIDTYDPRRWHSESVRMPVDTWRKLDRFVQDNGPHGFDATFTLRALQRTRGSALRAIVEEFLGQLEAEKAEDDGA
jgi:hypothetical protein